MTRVTLTRQFDLLSTNDCSEVRSIFFRGARPDSQAIIRNHAKDCHHEAATDGDVLSARKTSKATRVWIVDSYFDLSTLEP